MSRQHTEKLFDTGLGNPESNIYSRSCIGNNNGGLGNRDYTYGFKLATDLLLVLANNYHYIPINPEQDSDNDYNNRIYCYEDPLIYPILFNARHFIELSLKNELEKFIDLLDEFESLDKLDKSDNKINRKKNKFKHHCLGSFHSADLIKSIRTHSVLDLFTELKKISITIDREIHQFFTENILIEKLITELDSYDPNGETFRYRTSSDYKTDNLDKFGGLIDRENFSNQFENIKLFFEQLSYLLDIKIFDFRTMTWTKKLSRNDLVNISKKLPNANDWGNDEFNKIKKLIINEYKLSNNDFSKALQEIKENFYLMSNVGMEKPIAGINKNTLIKMMNYEKNSVCEFSADELRTITNINELGQDKTSCECYDAICEKNKPQNYSDAYFLHSVDYVIGKAILSTGRYFLTGLKLLGQTTLINDFNELGLPQSSKLWQLEEMNRQGF